MLDGNVFTKSAIVADTSAPGPASNLVLVGGTVGVQAQTEQFEILGVDPNLVQSTVINNGGTGVSRLRLIANGSTVDLEASPFGGATVYAPNQEIWLQNRTSGAAPLVVETDSDVTVNYGFNNLSDAKVKANVRDADLGWLQSVFDRAAPKSYDRLGFLAQDFEGAGVTGKTYREGEELLTLDYSRLTAVLWGVVKRLQARVEDLEEGQRRRPKAKAAPRRER